MKTLIMNIGLPRSGKSTWSMKQDCPVVSRDAIRLAHHGEAFNPKCEEFITFIENLMVDSLFEAGHENIILDACHTSLRYRNRWRNRMNGRDVQIVYNYFDTDIDTCKKRAIATGQEYLLPVIDRMHKAFVPLTKEERPYKLDRGKF